MSGIGGVKMDIALDVRSSVSLVAAQFDARPVKKRIALVVLATDHTTELDFARMCDPSEIGIYANRIDYQNPGTRENLLATGPRLTEAAAQILPGEAVDVIAYSCTAASVVLGNDAVGTYLNAGKPGTPFVTPSSAALAAFKALGAQKISVLTPYSENISNEVLAYFSAHGPKIVSALFLSCTGLRAAVCIDRIEARTGKPVVSSNQAMIWRCLREVGSKSVLPGYGRLFRH